MPARFGATIRITENEPVNVSDLGTILGLWAHPDDEAYGTAGIMATAVDAGQRVVVVTATYGEKGFPAGDTTSIEERKALRGKEVAECLRILGVTEHRYLDYADGGCKDVPDETGAAGLAAAIAEVQPDTILTFGPDGGTGHPDHIAICRWSTLAMSDPAVTALDRKPRLLYSTKSVEWADEFMAGRDRSAIMMAEGLESEPDPADKISLHYRCDDAMAARKLAALKAQASQVESFISAVGEEAYVAMFRDEFFRDPVPEDAGRIARSRNLKFRE